MAYFARKLWYGAHDGDDSHVFAAFLELRRRKNGKPVAFVLFEHRVFTSEYPGRASGTCENRMLRFPQCTSTKEALERFIPGQKEFPGWNCEQWEKTTAWAYSVGVGGSYQLHRPGRWVRTPMPNPWRNRRRRSSGRTCDTAFQLRQFEHELRYAEVQAQLAESDASVARYNIENFDDDDSVEYESLVDALSRTQTFSQMIDGLRATIQRLTDELRFTKAKALGVSYWPRKEDGTIDQTNPVFA